MPVLAGHARQGHAVIPLIAKGTRRGDICDLCLGSKLHPNRRGPRVWGLRKVRLPGGWQACIWCDQPPSEHPKRLRAHTPETPRPPAQ